MNVSRNIFPQSESPGGGLDSAETVVPGQPRDPKKGKKSGAYVQFKRTPFAVNMPVAFRWEVTQLNWWLATAARFFTESWKQEVVAGYHCRRFHCMTFRIIYCAADKQLGVET